ncbi:Structural maintenance of chromosomes protein 5 [Blyttiomyces sp. JEL0837]|nr:Structural maintenance of chromosomes protein 5 [Blyttiomyces sp. JEL0837]
MDGPTKRPQKRSRAESENDNNTESYPVGSILNMKLRNFVTYSYVEFQPGPHLNMVIGPNGTGKSTIVCAIALGLGGKPEILGRAKEVKDFVKKDEDKATIEIELKAERGSLIVERSFKNSANTSTWKLNGQIATEKEVKERVGRLNIQVDNLCQFLPQDRVSEFAQMQPPQLLRETERAAGTSDMLASHESLIEKSENLRAMELALTTEKLQLENAQRKKDALEERIQRYQERERLLKDVKLLQMAIPWTQYELSCAEYKRVKQARLEIEHAKNAEDAKLEPLKAKVETLKVETSKHEATLSRCRRQYEEQVTKKLQDLNEKIGAAQTAEKTAVDDINHARQEQRLRVDRMTATEAKKVKLEQDLAKMKEELEEEGLLEIGNSQSSRGKGQTEIDTIKLQTDEIAKKVTGVQREKQAVRQELDDFVSEKRDLENHLARVQHELRSLNSVVDQKLETLRSQDKNAYDATQWLRKNRNAFEANVFEPLFLGIQPTRPEFAKALETALGPSRLTNFQCFVTISKQDYYRLTDQFYEKMRIRCNVVYLEKDLDEFRRPLPREEIQRLGFDGYLIEFLSGPRELLAAACQMAQLHEVPVTNNPNTDLNRLDKNTFKINHDAIEQKEKDVQHLHNRIKEAEEKISQKNYIMLQLDEHLKRLQEQEAELRERRRQILEKKTSYDRKNAELVRLNFAINNLNTDVEKLEVKIKDLQKSQKKHLDKRISLVKDFANVQTSAYELFKTRTMMTLHEVDLNVRQKEASVELDKVKDSSSEVNQAYELVMRKFDEVKKTAVEHLRVAQKTIEGIELEEKEDMQELRSGVTLDELKDRLVQAQAKADLLENFDNNILTEYKTREADVKKLTDQVGKKEQETAKLTSDIAEIRGKWLPSLQALVHRISNTFSSSFDRIGCVGEVQLKQDDEDYSKWGINILVKFRDHEKLQALTAHRQSGGERSVSTIIYLMSLQELSTSPFRVVDEINQGMDPRNERLIHSQIVDVGCKTGNSQYFLVTPKLLQDLDYHKNMKILVIYNGEHQPEKFAIGEFVQRKKRAIASQQ